jgi:hypothetical protein
MADNEDFEKLVKAFEFGNTYPGIAPVSAEQQGTGAHGAPSQLQQTVTQALQGVLGRSFKQGDYRSFRAALEVSFEIKETGGRTSYQWRPRAYPSKGATDIGGGISGAQYSLVSFATGMYEKTLPLIEQLHSLITDADQENVAAAKAIYRSVWGEFIGELSREGGPRAPRANALSTSLFNKLSDKRATGHLVRLGGLLGMLQVDDDDGTTCLNEGRLNITRRNVVTTEEEGNLTNFISLADYFFAVDMSWDNYRKNFFQKDLGTGLLTLERQLSVLEESVNEVYGAMDSVMVEQSERLAILIDFKQYKDVTIEDFLSWIASFASTEAPSLIREGGRWGVEAILPTARELLTLTGQFIDQIEAAGVTTATADSGTGGEGNARKGTKAQHALTMPAAFNHGRVLNPLSEVKLYLGQVVATARKIAGA